VEARGVRGGIARAWPAPGASQPAGASKKPGSLWQGSLALVPKDLGVEGELRQGPLYTEAVAATFAFLEEFSSENDDSRALRNC
jgi:hypothetical protein